MVKVELVSKTQGVGIYDALSQGEIVEAVARHGTIKDYGKLIAYLIKHKHWSPLEHVHFTFRIETSRSISAQMIRHRSFHWQEFSQRYSEVQEFMPIELRKQAEKNHQSSTEVFDPIFKEQGLVRFSQLIKEHLEHTQFLYKKALELGVARECAREILPMCSKTIVHMTGNLRDFLGYLNVRCEEGTQKEHREVALAIGRALNAEMPEIFNGMDWESGNFM